jgi:uncharacterized membrane protein affecting hemolysin expression
MSQVHVLDIVLYIALLLNIAVLVRGIQLDRKNERQLKEIERTLAQAKALLAFMEDVHLRINVHVDQS